MAVMLYAGEVGGASSQAVVGGVEKADNREVVRAWFRASEIPRLTAAVRQLQFILTARRPTRRALIVSSDIPEIVCKVGSLKVLSFGLAIILLIGHNNGLPCRDELISVLRVLNII